MKKRRINFRRACYFMLILSVLSGIATIYCFGSEMKESAVSNAKKIVNSSAYVGRAYF